MAKLLKALAHPETSSLWATTIRSRLERAPCRLVGPANPAPKHRARNARGEARKLGQAGGYRENDRLSVPGRLPGHVGLGLNKAHGMRNRESTSSLRADRISSLNLDSALDQRQNGASRVER